MCVCMFDKWSEREERVEEQVSVSVSHTQPRDSDNQGLGLPYWVPDGT